MNRFRQYSDVSVLIAFLIVPAVVRADCPDGIRTTTDAERQEYIQTVNALNAAVPAGPAGWQSPAVNLGSAGAPTSTCKGLKLTVAPYSVTYVSLEQRQMNEQGRREREARIAALRKLSPDEQKQADDFNRQGMQISAQSAAARRNNNPAEADRLRAQAKELYAKSGAIHRAHRDRTEPQIRAIANDFSNYGSPEVKVHLAVDDLPVTAGSDGEKVQIPAVPLAFFNDRKNLVLSFGHDAIGRNISVRLEGDRKRAMTIARLFAESSLRTLAAK